ncbi:hypothetical protein ACVIM8_006738 [Bradyrhizobium sp. USDA 4529]
MSFEMVQIENALIAYYLVALGLCVHRYMQA